MIRTHTVKVTHVATEDLNDLRKAIESAGWTPEIELESMENWLE